ncbi:MAG: hypothetical protein WB613_05150, partial [Pseudolabrys sp.]
MDGRGGFAKLPERSSNKWRDVRQWHKADIGHYRYHCRGAKPVQTFYSLISYLLSLISLADLYPDFGAAVCHSHPEIRL